MWESVKLANGAYRIQNIKQLTEPPDLNGFRNCTECDKFADQLNCVRGHLRIESTASLWIGMTKLRDGYMDVAAVSWMI